MKQLHFVIALALTASTSAAHAQIVSEGSIRGVVKDAQGAVLPDVTIYEGAGVNNGWVDYRDRHRGPELKAFENLEFGHSNRRVHMLGDRAAYAISEYFIETKMKERLLDNIGRETLLLEKQSDGSWKIRHSHTSGRARPAK